MMTEDRLPPVHPGEVMYAEFLKPMGLTAYALAKALRVPAPRIYEIVKQKRGITADTALRLARYFGMSAGFWMGLQAQYDLETEADRLADVLLREITPRAAASYDDI